MIPHNRPNVGDAEYVAVMNVMNTDWLSEGPVTAKFEMALEEYLGAPVCVVNSGSSALMCALLASGFEPGDSVVVPAITHIATLSAPYILGANIRVVDVDLDTFNMIDDSYYSDFILPVDVAGVPAKFSYDRNVIHDSAQSFGTRKSGGPRCYSFQMTKQLTTVEGGCIVGAPEFISVCKRIKNYGRTEVQYIHDIIGTNWRTTDIASAIGLVQLEQVDYFIKRRLEVMDRYKAELKNAEFQEGAPTMFAFVKIPDSSMLEELQDVGIDTRRIWFPLHLQPCVKNNPRVHSDHCPNAEMIYNTTISLPLSNGITDDEVDTIIKEFNKLSNA